jgi:hypothetical protein
MSEQLLQEQRLEGGFIGKLSVDRVRAVVLVVLFAILSVFYLPLLAVAWYYHDDPERYRAETLYLGVYLLIPCWIIWFLVASVPFGRGIVYSRNSLCVVDTGGSGFCFQRRRKLKWSDLVEIKQFIDKQDGGIALTWKVPQCWKSSWTCSGMISRTIIGLTRVEVREFMDFFQQLQISVEKVTLPRIGTSIATLFRIHPSDYPLEALYFGQYHQKDTYLVAKLVFWGVCVFFFLLFTYQGIFIAYWAALGHIFTLSMSYLGLDAGLIDFAAGLRFDLVDKSLVFSYRWLFRKRQRIIELEDIVDVTLERTSFFSYPYPMLLTLKLRNRVISVPVYDSPQTEGNLNEFCRIASLKRGFPLAWRRIGL